MAIAVADTTRVAASAAGVFAHIGAAAAWPRGLGRQLAAALEAVPLAALPLVLGPLPPAPTALAAAVGAAGLFVLLDLAGATRQTGARVLPFLLLLAAAGVAFPMGDGLPLLALAFLLLRLCARHWADRSPLTAASLVGATAACRVDAGCLVVGHADGSLLLLSAAAIGAFTALATAAAGARRTKGALPPAAEARAPTRLGQMRELALFALLAACAAANLALLGGDPRVQAMGFVGAYLPAPFLLLGLLRCAWLAVGARGATPCPPSLGDPLIAATALGWAAAVTAGPWLSSLPWPA